MSRRESFVTPLLRRSTEALHLVNQRTGAVIASTLEMAADGPARRKGLLGRDVFHEGQALIIAPCSGVHTVGMRFEIDVVFVTRAGIVTKVQRRVTPWRICLSFRAFAAIELPAGTIAGAELLPRDTLAIAPARTSRLAES